MENQKTNTNPIKTKTEIEALRKACDLSSRLHIFAMTMKCSNLSELEVAGRLNNFKREQGDHEWAYDLLVASGARSTEVHAYPTSSKIENSELLLIDAGLKFQGWCADITRTWPAGTKFSDKQKIIYEIVLRAQKEVISRVRPGENLIGLHQVAQDYLREGLLLAGVIKEKEISRWFPHKTSHWIGQKVHDPCPHFNEDGTPLELREGMCFTVEPGLYFADPNHEFYGIAVRIEDVVVVTSETCEVLSSVPNEIAEIEELRGRAM